MLLLNHLSSTSSKKHILYHPDKTSHKAIECPYSSKISTTYIVSVRLQRPPSVRSSDGAAAPPGVTTWCVLLGLLNGDRVGMIWEYYGGTMINIWDNMVDACEMYCSEML